jgi:prepilin-type N-terminal cleavage/methylation domain-containing protein
MKNFNKNKRSAFSLIELSIVLIIIGLLIAGITGGASLIKSSELRSAMGEARGYSVAVNAFYTQFDAYPGDFKTLISANDTAGDGNGFIEFTNGTASEGYEAFRDLYTVGAITSNVTATTGTTMIASSDAASPGADFPSSKIANTGWIFDSSEDTEKHNYVVLTAAVAATSGASSTNTFTETGTSVAFGGALTPTDALSIDTKSDDSKSTTGEVRALGDTTCHDGSAATPAGTYAVATTTKTCAIAFNIDI